jgi:hypothetical protein
MQGTPLRQTIADDTPIRQAGLFGIHGGQVNVTDGRYVYMRGAVSESNQPLFQYTHMPTHMRGFFSLGDMRTVKLAKPFSFTKGLRTMKVAYSPRKRSVQNPDSLRTLLFDLQTDPQQLHPIRDETVEKMMIDHLAREMKASDAPREQYQRLGLKG